MVMNSELARWEVVVMAYFKHYPGISPKGLGKTTTNFNQDSL
jgi:hypothetical protein